MRKWLKKNNWGTTLGALLLFFGVGVELNAQGIEQFTQGAESAKATIVSMAGVITGIIGGLFLLFGLIRVGWKASNSEPFQKDLIMAIIGASVGAIGGIVAATMG